MLDFYAFLLSLNNFVFIKKWLFLSYRIMSESNSKGTSNGQEQTNGPITNGNSIYNASGDTINY